jgi:hypothetical protein
MHRDPTLTTDVASLGTLSGNPDLRVTHTNGRATFQEPCPEGYACAGTSILTAGPRLQGSNHQVQALTLLPPSATILSELMRTTQPVNSVHLAASCSLGREFVSHVVQRHGRMTAATVYK